MISDFVRVRAPQFLSPREVERLRDHLLDCLSRGEALPHRGRGIDWRALAADSRVDEQALWLARERLRPGLEALRRELRKSALPSPQATRLSQAPCRGRTERALRHAVRLTETVPRAAPVAQSEGSQDLRPPEPFHVAFDASLRAHQESTADLRRALAADGLPIDYSTLRMWRLGLKSPVNAESFAILEHLEARWSLPAGHLRRGLPHPSRAVKCQAIPAIGGAERRRLAWHLPDDFDRPSRADQEEILEWVRRVVVSGATDYRRYQSAAAKHRFAVRFPQFQGTRARPIEDETCGPVGGRTILAPAQLAEEMAALLAFKTATLSPFGYTRRGVWAEETASQKVEHFGLLFGALAAVPDGPVRGRGAPASSLTFALLGASGLGLVPALARTATRVLCGLGSRHAGGCGRPHGA